MKKLLLSAFALLMPLAAFTIAAIFFIGLRLYEKKPKKIRTNPRHKV